MRKLLNTLYVTTDNAYLSLDGENVKIEVDDEVKARFPLHIIEGIQCFSWAGASPALIGKCVKNKIGISFYNPYGKFLFRAMGDNIGNVVLRKEQYRISDDKKKSVLVARNMIAAKIYNAKEFLYKELRNHPMQINSEPVKGVADGITLIIKEVKECDNLEYLRGLEGKAAQEYFSVFNEFILNQKGDFQFLTRSRRPPLDNVNAMLSFGYSLLNNECTNALSGVGLDPYVGFMHSDRAGRESLALDLMEEFRTLFVDRMVLYLINNRRVSEKDFVKSENGAVEMSENARKIFLQVWQERKKDTIMHPFLKEQIEWGLVPHVQALLLARYLRGDLDAYPPFFWR